MTVQNHNMFPDHHIQYESGNPHWLPPVGRAQLAHIPGEDGLPILGCTLEMLRDPTAFGRKMAAKYGHVYRTYSFGRHNISLIGAEANELVLLDRAKQFSSEQGWGLY